MSPTSGTTLHPGGAQDLRKRLQSRSPLKEEATLNTPESQPGGAQFPARGGAAGVRAAWGLHIPSPQGRTAQGPLVLSVASCALCRPPDPPGERSSPETRVPCLSPLPAAWPDSAPLRERLSTQRALDKIGWRPGHPALGLVHPFPVPTPRSRCGGGHGGSEPRAANRDRAGRGMGTSSLRWQQGPSHRLLVGAVSLELRPVQRLMKTIWSLITFRIQRSQKRTKTDPVNSVTHHTKPQWALLLEVSH